jgi:hypothetical protein
LVACNGEIWMFASTTCNGSHAPVEGKYAPFPPPRKVARNDRIPGVFTGNANVVASNCPLASNGPSGPELAAGEPEQSPFRNQSTFTFPVGTGRFGSTFATRTESCTVEPTGTAVTT